MGVFRWLHFSDLHWGAEGQRERWGRQREDLFDDLEYLKNAMGGPWDAVFFTGDLVDRGDDSGQFIELIDQLEELRIYLHELGSDPCFLAVPGNHDIVRPDPAIDPSRTALVEGWFEDPDILNLTLPEERTRGHSPYGAAIAKAFENYTDCIDSSELRFPKPSSLIKGRMPGDFAATIEAENFKVAVVGLNTAFLQLRAGDFRHRLALSSRQVVDLTPRDYFGWLQGHDACLLLTHHPCNPEWLHNRCLEDFMQNICAPGVFAARLNGHCHVAESKGIARNGAVEPLEITGYSLFGQEKFTKWSGIGMDDRIFGYLAGEIDFASNPTISIWPRVSLPEGNNRCLKAAPGWHLERDRPRTPPQPIPVLGHRAPVAPVAVRDRPLRLGSLAVSNDRTDIRRQLFPSEALDLHEENDDSAISSVGETTGQGLIESPSGIRSKFPRKIAAIVFSLIILMAVLLWAPLFKRQFALFDDNGNAGLSVVRREGDSGALAYKPDCKEHAKKGTTSIQFTYDPALSLEEGWAGLVFEMTPDRSLPRHSGSCTFWVKGRRGGEMAKFELAGSRALPTAPRASGEVLSDKWMEYRVAMRGASHTGAKVPFKVVVEKPVDRPLDGATVFYVDDISCEYRSGFLGLLRED